MKLIISCCERKNGKLFIHNGETINFVSNINEFTPNKPNDGLFFHPDDLIPNEKITWRNLVSQQEIRNDLLQTYNLYRPKIYSSLFQHFGFDLFIFSAGWGIVRADYKLPKYDVTFSNGNNIPTYAIRNQDDIFNDFNQLEGIDENERIIFIGGKNYVLPFCLLTDHLPNEKIIYYKNKDVLKNNPYKKNNFQFIYYETNRRTNWHYEIADKLIKKEIKLL
jgi:hypothetical protein